MKRSSEDGGREFSREAERLYGRIPADRLWDFFEHRAEDIDLLSDDNPYRFILFAAIEKGRDHVKNGEILQAQQCATRILDLQVELEKELQTSFDKRTRDGQLEGNKDLGRQKRKQAAKRTAEICEQYKLLVENYEIHEILNILSRRFGFTIKTIQSHLKKGGIELG